MNRKAFTLIELLVVVAIIGILAAVGVVAYNGYTSAAKVSIVKTQKKMMTNLIQTEVRKCEIGAIKVMGGHLECLNLSSIKICNSITFYNNADLKFKNPYRPTYGSFECSASRVDGDQSVGQIKFNNLGNNTYTVKACFKTPCSDANNRIEDTFRIEF